MKHGRENVPFTRQPRDHGGMYYTFTCADGESPNCDKETFISAPRWLPDHVAINKAVDRGWKGKGHAQPGVPAIMVCPNCYNYQPPKKGGYDMTTPQSVDISISCRKPKKGSPRLCFAFEGEAMKKAKVLPTNDLSQYRVMPTLNHKGLTLAFLGKDSGNGAHPANSQQFEPVAIHKMGKSKDRYQASISLSKGNLSRLFSNGIVSGSSGRINPFRAVPFAFQANNMKAVSAYGLPSLQDHICDLSGIKTRQGDEGKGQDPGQEANNIQPDPGEPEPADHPVSSTPQPSHALPDNREELLAEVHRQINHLNQVCNQLQHKHGVSVKLDGGNVVYDSTAGIKRITIDLK